MSDNEQQETPQETPRGTPEKIIKPKRPGRVAAGKKLAEMNRKNKAKKQAKIQEPDSTGFFDDINFGYVIGGLGVIIAAGSLYLQWKRQKEGPQWRAVVHEPKPEPKPEPKKSRIPEME